MAYLESFNPKQGSQSRDFTFINKISLLNINRKLISNNYLFILFQQGAAGAGAKIPLASPGAAPPLPGDDLSAQGAGQGEGGHAGRHQPAPGGGLSQAQRQHSGKYNKHS